MTGQLASAASGTLLTNASPCARCTEACCKEYLVTITGLDMYRIARGLGLAPLQFAVAVPVQREGIEGFRLDPGEDRFQLALDKQRNETHAGWCIFWMPFGATSGRCGIYAHRPQVCSTYPATLVDGEVARRTDVLCPEGSWGPGSSLVSEAWRRRTERQYAELEIDALVNERWNASQVPAAHAADALDSYLTWIAQVYEHLAEADGSPLDWVQPNRSVLESVRGALDAVPLA
jgi:Fe-S-cluster containining protein